MAGLIKGVMRRVQNLDLRFGTHPEYIAVKVDREGLGKQEEVLLLTDADLEAARKRAERCPKTLKANATGWLRNIFD
tara:strand:+ start:216 stop:446 length:231 start_codon:yes stop_codon:yes gene_type:complete